MNCLDCIYYKEECRLSNELEKDCNCKFYLPKEMEDISEEEFMKCIRWMYEMTK